MSVVVTGAQGRIPALADAIGIVAAARRASVAKEVAVFACRTLKVLGAFSRAIGKTNGWVVVVRAREPWRAVAVVARLWVNTIGLFTNKSVWGAVELVVARGRWLTNTIGTVRSIGAFTGAGTAIGWSTCTFDAFTVSILATGYT